TVDVQPKALALHATPIGELEFEVELHPLVHGCRVNPDAIVVGDDLALVRGTWAGLRFTNILIPQGRMFPHKVLQQFHAFRVMQHLQLDAARRQVSLRPAEVVVLADYHARNTVEEDCATAHIAGREGRVEHRAPVLCGTEASSVLQAVHLRMQYRAAPLHAPVVTAADDPAVEHEHCADRDAAAAEALPRFLDRRLQKLHAFSLPLNRPIQTIYSAE